MMARDPRLLAAASVEGFPMVRLQIYHIMKARGISAYALSRGAKLSYPSAYRLSRIGGVFGRLHSETLDALCLFFKLQPGRLIRWTPDKPLPKESARKAA